EVMRQTRSVEVLVRRADAIGRHGRHDGRALDRLQIDRQAVGELFDADTFVQCARRTKRGIFGSLGEWGCEENSATVQNERPRAWWHDDSSAPSWAAQMGLRPLDHCTSRDATSSGGNN